MTKEYSKCCLSSVRVHSADEGTSYYICNSCNEACDITHSQASGSMTKELREEIREWLGSHGLPHNEVEGDLLIDYIIGYAEQREREARKKEAELLYALGLMYAQYCSKPLGHDFMGAGEAAISLLEDYGIHDESWEWTDKTYDKLEEVVAALKETTK